MTTSAIEVTGLAKRYRIGTRINRHPTVRDAIADATARMLRRRPRADHEEFWALRDVSFSIGHGEVTGIIGRNGAGKSTLLKILSRITRPTEGRAVLRGRVGSLLEVGTGFHPELTGRENVFLNGAILGMTRAEILRKLDEIIDFAEVNAFVDTPVKHYSSGMYLRLAFAVAAHLEPEILLVDEVLAVGDANFQKKCMGKMRDVARAGRTVLLVSHNLDAILRLCSHALLIADGRLAAFDESGIVVSKYLTGEGTKPGPGQWIAFDVPVNSATSARFVAARYTSGDDERDGHAYPGGPLEVAMRIASAHATSIPSLAITIRSQTGLVLVNADVITEGTAVSLRPGLNEVDLRIDALHLNPGLYLVDLWLGDASGSAIDWREAAFYLEVMPDAAATLGRLPRRATLVPCVFRVSETRSLEPPVP